MSYAFLRDWTLGRRGKRVCGLATGTRRFGRAMAVDLGPGSGGKEARNRWRGFVAGGVVVGCREADRNACGRCHRKRRRWAAMGARRDRCRCGLATDLDGGGMDFGPADGVPVIAGHAPANLTNLGKE